MPYKYNDVVYKDEYDLLHELKMSGEISTSTTTLYYDCDGDYIGNDSADGEDGIIDKIIDMGNIEIEKMEESYDV